MWNAKLFSILEKKQTILKFTSHLQDMCVCVCVPVSAASKEAHDFASCLILFLSQERSSAGTNSFFYDYESEVSFYVTLQEPEPL